MTTITLESARRAVAAAEAKAAEIGGAYVITVVDAAIQPVAVVRQDGAPVAAIDASLSKARTTLYFGGAPTAALQGATQPGGPLYGIENAVDARLAFLGGAVPVTAEDGTVIGAVGVGGGSAEQDNEVAEAAAAAV